MASIESGLVYQVGTFNGNPLSMAAARASLSEVMTPDAYVHLEHLNDRLHDGLSAIIDKHGFPAHVIGLGAKGCIVFATDQILNYRDWATKTNGPLNELAWLYNMNRGVFMTPGREEEWTLSVQHDDADVDRFIDVFAELAARPHRREPPHARGARGATRGASSTSTASRTRRRPSCSGGKLPQETVAAHRARGAGGRAGRPRPRSPSTAGRAWACSSRSSSTRRSAATRTASGGTSRASPTCSPTARPDQIERYLRPGLRGERGECYAITEAHAGSDRRGRHRHRAPPRRPLGDGDREVVRDERRRGRLLHRPRARDRRGREQPRPHALPRRQGPGRRDRRRPAVHAHVPGRPSDDPLRASSWPTASASGRSGPATRSRTSGSSRSACTSPRAASARWSACSRSARPGRSSASSSGSASWTSRASRSRSPTPPARASR